MPTTSSSLDLAGFGALTGSAGAGAGAAAPEVDDDDEDEDEEDSFSRLGVAGLSEVLRPTCGEALELLDELDLDDFFLSSLEEEDLESLSFLLLLLLLLDFLSLSLDDMMANGDAAPQRRRNKPAARERAQCQRNKRVGQYVRGDLKGIRVARGGRESKA